MATENAVVKAQERFEVVANEVNGLAATLECPPATRMFRLAEAMTKLDEALTADVLAPIARLQGSRVGFKTDKDKDKEKYQVQVIREVVKEAILFGAHMTGNEVNIISGQAYFTKEFFMRAVREIPGLTDLEVNFSTPVIEGDKAKVRCSAKWKLNGVEKSIGYDEKMPCTFQVRVYDAKGGGADQAIGKAGRRLYKRIFEVATGSITSIPDGDVEDVREVDAQTVESAPSTPPQSRTETLRAKMERQSNQPEGAANVDVPLDGNISPEFKQAYSKLNTHYNTHSRDIDDLLFKHGASRELPDMQNTTDAKEIVAVIRTAAEFKPGKDS